jgi:hypothetical protein
MLAQLALVVTQLLRTTLGSAAAAGLALAGAAPSSGRLVFSCVSLKVFCCDKSAAAADCRV